MNKNKKVINIEEEPIDKVEHFVAKNFKKMLAGVAGLLIIFLLVYTYTKMSDSKNQMLTNKIGQLEMIAMMSDANAENVAEYVKASSDLPSAGDYINLKAAEMLVEKKDMKNASAPLGTASGEFNELADSLRYDTGIAEIDPKSYIGKGKLGSVWYYRACLAATGEDKSKLMSEFEKNYPDSELLKQLKRWNG